jgi:hypothetical protein
MDSDEQFDNHWPYGRAKSPIPRQNAAQSQFIIATVRELRDESSGALFWTQCADDEPGAIFWIYNRSIAGKAPPHEAFTTRAAAQAWIDK